MSRFRIYSRDGRTVRAEGKLSYHGTYLQPAYVEFREIASDTTIPWQVGDYVDYARTGIRYTLYQLPETVQNSSLTGVCGEKVVYSGVRFYAPSKELEVALYLDLVTADNTIHFSTQKSIATFEDVAGICRRLQACMDHFYPGRWAVRVAPGLSASRPDILEARDLSMEAGSTVLDALGTIYDTWDSIGWVYSYDSAAGKHVITVGGANVQTPSNTIAGGKVGKGQGLTRLKFTVANNSDLCTRLYAFGSSRNLPARYYNSKNIKDAGSVDIQNLMIPLARWGKTGGLPDASKAYLDASAEAQSFLGIRPKVLYFDGESYGDYYPSLEGLTIGDVRDAKTAAGDTAYVPSSTIYGDASERVDEVEGAEDAPDNGVVDTKAYSSYGTAECVGSFSGTLPQSGTVTLGSPTSSPVCSIPVVAGNYPSIRIESPQPIATVAASENATINARLILNDGYPSRLFNSAEIPLKVSRKDGSALWYLSIPNPTVIPHESFYTKVSWGAGDTGAMTFFITCEVTDTAGTKKLNMVQSITLKMMTGNDPYTYIHLRQIGFDISAQKSTVNGALGRIEMKTGMCAGRAFSIESVTYMPSVDGWNLKIRRAVDNSIGMIYPNTTYPVASGDGFVLTGILMPDIYVSAQEQRLYRRAQDVLAELSRPILMIEPSVDAKFVDENPDSFLEGRYFDFTSDVLDDTFLDLWDYSKLIDTLTINENESEIPTYALTLREKKHRSFRTVSYSSDRETSSSSSGTSDVTNGMTSQVTVAGGGKGEKGDPGPQGPAGPAGPKGDTGAQGPQGPQGEKGDKGDTGAQGPRGYTGAKGATGATGATGPQGPAGNTPYIGTDGMWYIDGTSTGVIAYGTKGDKGDKGDQGAAGDTPFIKGGNWWIGRVDTGVAATGPKGDTGPAGPQGPQGEPGADADGIPSLPRLAVYRLKSGGRELRVLNKPATSRCTPVLMVYSRRNGKTYKNARNVKRKKGWCIAMGDQSVFNRDWMNITGPVSLHDISTYVLPRYCLIQGKSRVDMLTLSLSQWNTARQRKGFSGFSGTATPLTGLAGSKKFGIAFRYIKDDGTVELSSVAPFLLHLTSMDDNAGGEFGIQLL